MYLHLRIAYTNYFFMGSTTFLPIRVFFLKLFSLFYTPGPQFMLFTCSHQILGQSYEHSQQRKPYPKARIYSDTRQKPSISLLFV